MAARLSRFLIDSEGLSSVGPSHAASTWLPGAASAQADAAAAGAVSAASGRNSAGADGGGGRSSRGECRNRGECPSRDQCRSRVGERAAGARSAGASANAGSANSGSGSAGARPERLARRQVPRLCGACGGAAPARRRSGRAARCPMPPAIGSSVRHDRRILRRRRGQRGPRGAGAGRHGGDRNGRGRGHGRCSGGRGDRRLRACATGAAALAGRATLAVRWVVVDLVDFVVVTVGSGASGSLGLSGRTVRSGPSRRAGAVGSGGDRGGRPAALASGAVWARSWAEDKARTAAIAVVARRIIFGFLWVMIKGNERPTIMDPSFRFCRNWPLPERMIDPLIRSTRCLAASTKRGPRRLRPWRDSKVGFVGMSMTSTS